MLTPDDIAGADLVIDIGCHPDVAPSRLLEWNIPDISDDAETAFATLHDAVTRLVETLRRSSPR